MNQAGDSRPLGSIPLGRAARIVGYAEGCRQSGFVNMGLLPGVEVTAIRSAPLGDPVEYAVMGSRVAIRRRDAAAVLVELIEP